MDIKTLEETVSILERELNLPSGFLSGLKSEDDWPFIIKAHAFLEALFTHVLIKSIGNEELRDIFSRLEMSNKNTGKAEFARALGLIDKDGFRFITKFSELRNLLVHDIGKVNFNFSEYVSRMDKNQFKSFVDSFAYFASEEELSIRRETVNELLRADPKLSVWYSIMHFTGVIYWKREVTILKRDVVILRRVNRALLNNDELE